MLFPARLSELTTEWLNEVLHGKAPFGSGRIVGFDAEPVSQRGGTSDVYILTLAYDRVACQGPRKILAKFSSENSTKRATAREHRLYQREVAFYSQYAACAGVATPVCYAARYNPADETCVLLLEYIETAHARESSEGSPEDIALVVRHLATFHAKWWGRTHDITGLESEYCPDFLERRINNVTRGVERLAGGFRTELGDTAATILDLWLANARPLAEYAKHRPMTMSHGSLHRGQILFSDCDPAALCIIDWQTVSIDFGANDLARIVVSGLTSAQRREREVGLIESYHRTLLEQGPISYSLSELLDDYRLGIVNLIAFHAQVFAVYEVGVVAKYWQGPDSLWDALFRWPGQAADERGALEWLKKTVASLPPAC
jgi:aminoglycoside phosphotransferase (APT) family kinase protein